MIDKPLEAIEAADIESLCFRRAPESRTLEFKREMPGRSDAAVKEFLDDVISLANAQGGDLIYGIDAVKGLANAVTSLELPDRDNEMLRLENILRDSVQPRLTVKLHWIPYKQPDSGVLLLRVPASLGFPHMRTYRGSSRFCSRNSAGKYDMDVHELRQAFTQSEQLPQRFRTLHDNALLHASGKEMPFALAKGPTAVVTIAPLGLFREERDLPITQQNAVVPAPEGRLHILKTLEGILAGAATAEGVLRGYVLTHWTGFVDSAWTIGGIHQWGNGTSTKLVRPKPFEQYLTDVAGATGACLREFGIAGPWVVLVTVFGIHGFELARDEHFTSSPAWRESATFASLVTDHLKSNDLAPLFKSFWLLFGEERPPLDR